MGRARGCSRTLGVKPRTEWQRRWKGPDGRRRRMTSLLLSLTQHIMFALLCPLCRAPYRAAAALTPLPHAHRLPLRGSFFFFQNGGTAAKETPGQPLSLTSNTTPTLPAAASPTGTRVEYPADCGLCTRRLLGQVSPPSSDLRTVRFTRAVAEAGLEKKSPAAVCSRPALHTGSTSRGWGVRGGHVRPVCWFARARARACVWVRVCALRRN